MEPARIYPFPSPGSPSVAPPVRPPRQLRRRPATVPIAEPAPPPCPVSATAPDAAPCPPARALRSLRETRRQREADAEQLTTTQREEVERIAAALRAEMEAHLAQVLELRIPAETRASLVSRLLFLLASIFLIIPPPEEQYRIYRQSRADRIPRPTNDLTPPSPGT